MNCPPVFRRCVSYMLSDPHNQQKKSIARHERLKSRSTILSLFSLNQHIKLYPFRLVWLIHDEHPSNYGLKIGVSVAKKIHKTAVKRNRIKRLMREGLRKNKHVIQPVLLQKNLSLSFMLIYIGKEELSAAETEYKIKQVLFRLADKIEKH